MNEKVQFEPEALANMLSYQVRLIQIAAYKNFESRTKGFGTAPRYIGLLRIIESNPGTNQSQLAKAVCLDRSSLVPILDTLTKEGLLERRPSKKDKRLRCVFLTPQGADLLSKIQSRVEEHEKYLVEPLSQAEQETLLRLLRRVSDHVRSEDIDSGALDNVA